MHALLTALVRMGETIRGRTVLHRTDNIALHYAIRNGGYAGSSFGELNLMARKVMLVCNFLSVRLLSEFVGSQAIIRSGADGLSRARVPEDHSMLTPGAYQQACRALGVEPAVDLFANSVTRRPGMPYFTSSLGDVGGPGCWGFDALAMPWNGVSYAFPPLRLVDVTVHKALGEARTKGNRIVLVAPHWPQRSWFALLARFSRVELGPMPEVVSLPPGAQRPIESERTWSSTVLWAFLIEHK